MFNQCSTSCLHYQYAYPFTSKTRKCRAPVLYRQTLQHKTVFLCSASVLVCAVPAAVDPLPATLRNVFASTEVRLTCSYRGYPQATPRWCKLSNDDITMTSSQAADGCAAYNPSCPYTVMDDSSSTTTLVIGSMQDCHRGLYRCIATNIANLQGSHSDVELDVLGKYTTPIRTPSKNYVGNCYGLPSSCKGKVSPIISGLGACYPLRPHFVFSMFLVTARVGFQKF